MAASPLSVAVLVDLYRSEVAGGHVKSWEKLAGAAAAFDDRLDLTIYVLGTRPGVEPVSRNARFVALRPVLGTAGLQAFAAGTDATDLSPYHPGLARRLPQHELWHATHTFSFGWTARRLALRTGRPLTASLQTDLPSFVRLYLRQLIGQTVGRGLLGSSLLDRFHVDDLAAGFATRHQRRLVEAAEHVFVSNDDDERTVAGVLGERRVSRLRRGVDCTTFRPERRDAPWLHRRYGVPTEDVVVLFAGRADATKGALTVARAVQQLRDRGLPVHLFVAGAGGDLDKIGAVLGSHATLPGPLAQEELANVYAAADIFAFPSTSETIGNVVAEAMASGLPVVLQAGTATNQWLQEPGRDGVLVDSETPESWARALEPLVTDEGRRQHVGRAARHVIVDDQPSWEQVLGEDLLPVWEQVTGRTFARPYAA